MRWTLARRRDRIEIIDRNTTFGGPDRYLDATGLVLLFDPIRQEGKWLGLNAGTLQAYFDNDGTIKWNGGSGILNETGLAVFPAGGSPAFGSYGVQIEGYGTVRFYAGDGNNRFLRFENGDLSWSGNYTVLSTTGLLTGTQPARICGWTDQTPDIEASMFASGTSGWRIDANGDAEFNNVRVRGAIAADGLAVRPGAGDERIGVGRESGRSDKNADLGACGRRHMLPTRQGPRRHDPCRGGRAVGGGRHPAVERTAGGRCLVHRADELDFGTYWRLTTRVESGPGVCTFPTGATVLNYGKSGDGVVRITADDTNSPYISIATHTGTPWTSLTERGRGWATCWGSWARRAGACGQTTAISPAWSTPRRGRSWAGRSPAPSCIGRI